jgi:hypothetical protein
VSIAGSLAAASCSSGPSGAGGGDAGLPDANYALEFNGTSDYATTGTGGFPAGADPQAISFWARPSNFGGTQVIVTLRRALESGVVVGIRNGSFEAWQVYGGGTLVHAPSPPDAGAWHHFAYVFDLSDGGSGVATLYVDGAPIASATASPNARVNLASWIGSLDGLSEFYAGDLDELRIWNVPRSQSEIMSDMAGAVADGSAGLVAYFDFNQVDLTSVPDLSPHGNNATLGGGDPRAMPAQVLSPVPLGP